MISLATGADEFDVSGICPDLQHRSTAIQLAFRRNRSRSPVSAFAGNVDVGEIAGSNPVSVCEFDVRTNGNRQISGQIHGDVACAGFQRRVGAVAGRQELGNDSACARFGARGRHSIQLNAATTGFSFNRTFGGTQTNAAAAGLDFHGTADVTQIDAAAARRGANGSLAALHLEVAGAGIQGRSLEAGDHHNAATTTFGVEFPFGRGDLDVAAAGANIHVAADRANIDCAAAGFRLDRAPYVVHVNAAAAALNLSSAGDPCGAYTSAISLNFRQLQVARDGDHEISRELPAPATLPIAHDPGRISLGVRADLVGLEFAPGLLLRRGIRATMNDVTDPRLRAALDPHRSHVDL